jgi:hypothetical protein
MKSHSMKLFAALVLALGLSLGVPSVRAQAQSSKASPKVVSAMGCLMKGDEPKEVWLEEKDGTIYGLESAKIKLNAHLGHEVTVTGYVLAEGKEEAGEEAKEQNKTGKHETADFRVLTLKMISTTCKQ